MLIVVEPACVQHAQCAPGPARGNVQIAWRVHACAYMCSCMYMTSQVQPGLLEVASNYFFLLAAGLIGLS